ncbi:MAG TPA: phospholipid carrier-dependent glycosyltransferase [Methylomirabilota bacterium]|nr:phospholipid carrier-dependent glycosyltransferase [Methylomirabilota bacterium]
MTGPVSGGYERGTGAPSRSTGMQGAAGAILIVLALGLALRLILAYLLPGSGFEADLGSFRFWASNLAHDGLHGFYERDFFHDYTPGYLYVLWLVGTVGNALGGIGDLIKVPPVLADLATGYLVWSMIRELGGRERLALLGAAVVVVNPIFWFDSVVWGQVDSVGVIFLLLGLRALWRDQPERASIFAVVAALVKPQLGILIPLVAVVTIRRALWPAPTESTDAEPREEPATGRRVDDAGLLGRARAWETRTDHPLRIVTAGVAGFLTAVVLCLPFGLSVLQPIARAPFFTSGLIDQIVKAGGGYPYLTVNAYNAWAVVPSDLGNSLASSGQWVCDAAALPADQCGAGVAVFGLVPAIAVGAVLLVASFIVLLSVAARDPDRLTLLVVLSLLALAFFALPTRVHERYGFPFFALGAIVFAISPRWRVAYVLLAIATFANMYVVLTTLYPPDHPEINPVRDWLGIGELLRSQLVITTVALMHTATFVWALFQVRADGRARLRDELDEARLAQPVRAPARPRAGPEPVGAWDRAASGRVMAHRADPVATGRDAEPAWNAALARDAGPVSTGSAADPAPAAGAALTLPSWADRTSLNEIGVVGWIRDRLTERPVRADRSRMLVGEGGGRLDRLDVWIMVVLLLATLGMRTFRLAEPYQMHFDEVYHARTATEFLQAWRYGESHDIYEWTHPHLAKYAMAAGIVLWGGDHVQATGDLKAPIRAAAIEHRREDVFTGDRAGERVHLATGDEIRTEDLRTRATVSVIAAPGSSALAVDDSADQLVVGFDDGRLATLDLTIIGLDGGDVIDAGVQPTELTKVDHPITHLLVTDDGATIIAASDSRLTAVETATGRVLGSTGLPGIADLATAGTGPALVAAAPESIAEPAAVASNLAELIGGQATDYETRIADATPGTSVVLGAPGADDTRKEVEAAIADGRLDGVEIVDLPRVAVATDEGISFIDPATAGVSSTIGMPGGAHGLAYVTGIEDPKLYVTSGPPGDSAFEIVAVGGDSAKNGPVATGGRHRLPGAGTRVAYDDATQQVHILGRAYAPEGSSGPGADRWTVYVVEPHANQGGLGGAVYADALLPDGMEPAAWALDVESQYPADDREELLVFGAAGQTATIDTGSHAFAWRLPGVIAGALMGVCLYLLARILFKRRLVAGLVAVFVFLEGMLFVQSRIGMNDVYVGLFIVAAYTLFAAVWTGWWRWRGAFWVAMPVIGLLLGLALASKWVAAYAIGALALLLLVRSALGRVVAILGLIAVSGALGYLAISVPEGQGLGNIPFLAIMVALTLVAVVTAVFHPIAWTDDEMRFAVVAPAAIGALVFFGALAFGRLDTTVAVGPAAFSPVLIAILAAAASLAVYAAFWAGGNVGYGPMAGVRDPDDPMRVLGPPAPAPTGWLRPGRLFGLPMLWAAIGLVAIPVAVYVISYLPWAFVENHQLWPGFPAGHTGQTLADLTRQMYDYHNGLSSPHPASSPWWAWPGDLKPVWFYQDSFANSTSAAIYDAGNLVIWWLGAGALVFVSVMAFRRRSLALGLIAIGFAAQWVSWARIDRPAFQYHYYTALPFLILALAYLVAELWHGPSRRTWLAARLAGATAIVAPAALWLFDRPLCGLVGVDRVNPSSQACPAVIPDLVLTLRTAGLIGVMVVGAVVLGRGLLTLDHDRDATGGSTVGFRTMAIAGIALAITFGLVMLLPDSPLFTLNSIPVEPIALLVAVPLVYLAAQVLAARDARRYVVGLVSAAVAWFVVFYPNIAALPLPSTVVNAYQGLLPTYLYAFQFPNSQVERGTTPLLTPTLAILTVAIAVTCLVVAYSASVWRLALAESKAAARTPSSGEDADTLARTGGGA